MEPTKVQNHLPAEATAARADRAPATQGSERGGAGSIQSSRPWNSGDQIELSSLAGRIVQVEGAHSAERASRVQDLARLYAEGRYQVEPGPLSQRIVAEWVANGAGAKIQ
ncbi:MAG TPA: flagellar biosynthesis anti-sigma factor FlgM [Bryobacteraceae bacterium]|nr:flagellar biosynthesis anti-sigma factor FlgM [Bryobacteraceae bacterium]